MSKTVLGCFSVVLSWSALLSLSACTQETSPRPPWANGDCNGAGCSPGGAPVGQGAPDAAGAPEDAASARDAGRVDAADAPTTVFADVRAGVDLDATSPDIMPLEGSVYRLTILDAMGWEQELALSAGDAVELSPSPQGDWFWFSQASDGPLLSTLVWVGPSSERLTVPVFTEQFFSDLAAGLANFPVALDEAAGHVVVRVTRDDGVYVPSVSAQVTSGVVAYGVGGTASDFQMETGETGTVVWLNAPTGGATTFTLTYQGKTQSVELPVVPRTVTLAAIPLNLQMP